MSALAARRLAVAAAAGVVLAGAAWWTGARAGERDGGQATGGEVATATAEVTRRDLRAQEEVDGTLGYGEARAGGQPGARAPSPRCPSEGAVVTRGRALYRVDGKPVPLLYGRLPAWRDLSVGVDDGPDVRQLEQNLVALGYDPDRAITVDDHFTWATRAAVRRWQEVLGLEETGTFAPGDAVWQPGPVRVGELEAAVGDTARPGLAAARGDRHRAARSPSTWTPAASRTSGSATGSTWSCPAAGPPPAGSSRSAGWPPSPAGAATATRPSSWS